MANSSDIRVHPPGAYERNWKEDFLLKQSGGVDTLVRYGRGDVSECGPERGDSGGYNMSGADRKDPELPNVRTVLVNGKAYKIRGPLSVLYEEGERGWRCLKSAISKYNPQYGGNKWMWNYIDKFDASLYEDPITYRFDIEPCGVVHKSEEKLTAYSQEMRINQMRGMQWSPDVVDRLTKSITKANEQLSKKAIQKSGCSRRNKVRLLLG